MLRHFPMFSKKFKEHCPEAMKTIIGARLTVSSLQTGNLPGTYLFLVRYEMILTLSSLLLSCIVFARRPLRLEELCDATAAAEAEDAALVDHTQKLFQSKILKICEPLIQVQAIEGARTLNSVCTLTHASVRRFLLKRPDVLGLKDSAAESEHYITEEIMANVCLKYLWQASYSKLLSRNGDTYCDVKGTDILNQQLLPYAAKYWDKHLDAIPGHRGWETCEDSKSLCNRVTRFIRSPQYITCIQTQSLFVGGKSFI